MTPMIQMSVFVTSTIVAWTLASFFTYEVWNTALERDVPMWLRGTILFAWPVLLPLGIIFSIFND